jgi:hypothetical protein
MAILTIQKPAPEGSAITLAPADVAGDNWIPNGREMFVCKNDGASPVSIVFKCYRPCDVAQVLHDVTQSVAAGATEYFPPCSSAFVDATTGYAKATCTPITSVTVGVVASL